MNNTIINDARYAMQQLRKAQEYRSRNLSITCVDDCIQRALDAVERIMANASEEIDVIKTIYGDM